jgi:putative toxin-antitoxin system antitoxin component (TIGR02293 family)
MSVSSKKWLTKGKSFSATTSMTQLGRGAPSQTLIFHDAKTGNVVVGTPLRVKRLGGFPVAMVSPDLKPATWSTESTDSTISELGEKPSLGTEIFVLFDGDSEKMIRQMRAGTPARAVPAVAANLGVSQEKLFELLRLPKSTIKGRISKDEVLSPTEQDRVYRAEKVLKKAIAVLEDENAARVWLNRANRALGGEVPLSMLDTEVGYELVLDTLGRIEYGVIS